MLRIASDFSLTPPAKSHQPPSRLRLSAFARRRSPHPAAKRFVQEAFRIGAAMRKALSICVINSNVAYSRKSRHFAPFLGHLTPILPAHRLCERQGPAAIRHPRKESGRVRSRDDGGPEPPPARSTPGEPGRAEDSQALPAFLIRLIDKFCAIRMSGGQVSACHEHPPAHRRSAWATRGLASHTKLPKMVGTVPTSIVYDKIAGVLRGALEE